MSRLIALVVLTVTIGVLQLACGSASSDEAGVFERSSSGEPPPPPPPYPDGGGEFKIPIGQKSTGTVMDALFEACSIGMCTPGGNPVECATAGSATLEDSGPQQVFCQIVPIEDHLESRCLHVGTQAETKACKTAADCAGGLGCVGEPTGGVCRKYCCGDPEAMCPEDTYCARQPLTGYPQFSALPEIPVCIPATKCHLLDDTTCPAAGQTCTIVRADGTTSCVEAGSGKLGEQCPCAAGYLCIQSLNQCKQLCHIGMDNECAPGAKCLGGSASYPEGFGVCIGESG